MSRFKTRKDAAEAWVSEFNAFPYGMISQLMKDHIDDWHEVTAPSVYDRVYDYEEGECGEIVEVIEDEDGEISYLIKMDSDDHKVARNADDFEIERDDYLPMWGTLWQFNDRCDDWWLDEDDGIRKMSECGFRVYEHEEWGYFFGIDGCGYDFYEAHWVPLYKARGLQWHERED